MINLIYKTASLIVLLCLLTAYGVQAQSIAGPSVVCNGEQNVSYNFVGASGGTGGIGGGNTLYPWILNGQTLLGGADLTIEIDFPSGIGPHTLSFTYGGATYTKTINVVSAGTISADTDVCYEHSTTVTATGVQGNHQWSRKVGAADWEEFTPAFNGLSFNSGSIKDVTSYRVSIMASCGLIQSNIFTITPSAPYTIGSIGPVKTICYDTSPGRLTSQLVTTGGSGSSTYRWQKKTGSGAFTDIAGVTTHDYTPGTLKTTTTYRRESINACGGGWSNELTITVRPGLYAGQISGNRTICYDAEAGTIGSTTNASGGKGTLRYQWEANSSGSWVPVSGATQADYNPGRLQQTTQFRRKVTDDCKSMFTVPTRITVTDELIAGAIKGDRTICYDAVVGLIDTDVLSSGGQGTRTYRWERKIGSGNWQSISGSNNSTYYDPAKIRQTRVYRRFAIDECTEFATGTVTIRHYDELSGGNILGEKTITYQADAGVLENVTDASGGNGGFTYQWQKAEGTANFTDISSATGKDYSPGTLEVKTKFRRKATNSCGSAFSNIVIVTVGANSLAPGETDINFITTHTPRISVKNVHQVELLSKDQKNFSVAYFDGLGRPVQQVAWQASPEGKDIIQPVAYDGYG
ncbi:MAG: DUF6443 domain-containing protein, partial [Cyclobacteriaceae bacterium]